MKKPLLQGFLVVDKPGGVTSRDVVNRAQKWFPRRTRIGHSGTLDPLATGALVLCVGTATRLTDLVQKMTKVYTTTAELGVVSDTDDADGNVQPHPVGKQVSLAEIKKALPAFSGTIEQVPPAYSAIKVDGKRAHSLARQGEEVQLQSRPVRIDAIDILRFEPPELELVVTCGKGTYIRSLVRDLGERLECGAMVKTLRRDRVGPFEAAKGLSLEATKEMAQAALLPLLTAVEDLPRVELSGEQIARVKHGNAIRFDQPEPSDLEYALLDQNGDLLAIAERRGELLAPTKVVGRAE